MSDLVREISRLLHRAEHEEYTDDPVDWGRIGALNEVHALAVKQEELEQRELHDLRKQIEDARFELSRGVLNLAVPRPEQTLAELVTEVVEEFQCTAVVGECEDHVCECDCDEDKLGWSQREEVRNAISILEGLL